jgi:hypothetical protein
MVARSRLSTRLAKRLLVVLFSHDLGILLLAIGKRIRLGRACGIGIHLRDLRNCRRPTFFLFLVQGETWSLLFHLCRVELERGKYPVLSSSRLLSSSSEFFCKCGPDSVRKKLHLLIFVLVDFLPFIVLLMFFIIGKQTLFVCDLLQVP